MTRTVPANLVGMLEMSTMIDIEDQLEDCIKLLRKYPAPLDPSRALNLCEDSLAEIKLLREIITKVYFILEQEMTDVWDA